MKFTLEIELGNDAMQTGSEVLKAIQRSFGQSYVCFQGAPALSLSDSMTIRDINGNTVGRWKVQS